ncbi:hypothetical protein JCM10207_003489 [Rhodosporidiobolus poonsookiae]
MTSRLRNPFKRQDSFQHSTPAAPALARTPSKNDDADLAVEGKEKLDAERTEQDEGAAEDPALLDVADLREEDRLANGKERPIENAEDMGLRLLSTADDPTMPVHTLRMYVLGLSMTCFAAVLGQIFWFRPSNITVSSLFILIITHILGQGWHMLLPGPAHGKFWEFINPGPFNIKEHVAVLIMASTAFSSAMAISVFAADELYYDLNNNYGVAIFTLIASQFLGYGLAGLMRSFLVFPTYSIFPNLIPNVQLFDVLHRDKDISAQRKRAKFFFIVGFAIFAWEWFPEFIAPTLTGVSIVCLARQNSAWVSRIFGGAYPNEGMGLLSICLDWAYITGAGPLFTPLSSQLSIYSGVCVGIVLICASYANNVWNAQNFPFMAQDLFYENGTLYDQTTILNADYSLNETALAEQGLPWYSTSMALYYLACDLALGATITHCALWYFPQVKEAIKSFRTRSINDPHYQKMLAYREVPTWVYGGIMLASFAMAMATCYTGDSHLPWYGVIVAFAIAIFLFPFLCLLPAITGWQVDSSELILMLGSAVVPGNSQASMWFTLYGSNAATQGIAFAGDLKLAQYTKLPPRTTLWVQSLGTVIGGILQIVIMKEIIKNQRDILLDPVGTNIWSGQNVQSFNSQAITWGALAKHMYAPGKTYAIMPFSILVGLLVPIPTYLLHRAYPKLRADLFITPFFLYGLGYLSAGINSLHFVTVSLAIFSQWYLRTRKATWFRKYNYLLSASLDAGVQFFTFIATFAVLGGSGDAVTMPSWGLNPADKNPDYCMMT